MFFINSYGIFRTLSFFNCISRTALLTNDAGWVQSGRCYVSVHWSAAAVRCCRGCAGWSGGHVRIPARCAALHGIEILQISYWYIALHYIAVLFTCFLFSKYELSICTFELQMNIKYFNCDMWTHDAGASKFTLTEGLQNMPIFHAHGDADPVVRRCQQF